MKIVTLEGFFILHQSQFLCVSSVVRSGLDFYNVDLFRQINICCKMLTIHFGFYVIYIHRIARAGNAFNGYPQSVFAFHTEGRCPA